MDIDYKGTKWFKCDLHLHTPASKCFQDQAVTADQWVARAIEQGLNCVAVTDHNTGLSIDAIKAAAIGKNITIFPGVEITCDTSKIHLLILFDVDKTTDHINDFLVKCDIKRENFGEQEAHTSINIFDVAEIAYKDGAVIIPAHIDEYNGLGSVSVANLEKFYALDYINAVQIVHKEFLNSTLQTTGNADLKLLLNDYYNTPTPAIDDSTVKEWFTSIKYAVAANVALLTFSDNPHEPQNSKHGLAGIGSRFTWIKMDNAPTLEGLRQAFLLPQFRIKNEFDCPGIPYETPELWIKSISITETTITNGATPLLIEFSPQLTTIIGGRGSGKSSILRFIRGLFNRTADLIELNEIFADHHEFYKQNDPRTKLGVLTANSKIEIDFVRNNILHKITASGITTSNNQTITIQKFDNGTSSWNVEAAEGYIDFFSYEQYSQKQIYEIAQEPNSLRERIDKSITGMEVLINNREVIKKSFLEKSAAIRTIQQQITGKGRLQTEIRDLEERIQLFHQSGIASLLTSKEKFTGQQNDLTNFLEQAKERENNIDALIATVELPDIDYTNFDAAYGAELGTLSKTVVDGYTTIKEELERVKQSAEQLRTVFESALTGTTWKTGFDQNQTDFDEKKAELETQGINDISNFEMLTQAKALKEKELEAILAIEANLAAELTERDRLKNENLLKTKEITAKRKAYVASLLQDDKVKVSINSFRNKTDFVNKIRTAIQRDNGFQSDVDLLVEMCFNGNVEQTINNVRDVFLKIKRNETVTGITGYFVTLVTNMTFAQIDEIELLLPEDEIDIKYKPSGSTVFKPLSTASAGQKTTAVLTFILSQGNVPLVLDQPEDDLDNRLVYELIVDRLKQAKEHRQIIVVTHNANIPVNGDAEYIISMNSESNALQVLHSGTVEQLSIKKEICDVMEGSEQAFEMRSKRYQQIV